MAEPIESRVKKTLNDRQVAERKNVLSLLSIEKMKLERKSDALREEIKPITSQITMLDGQIATVAQEIDEKVAWIPAQMALGEDPNAEPVPGASRRAGKKTAGKKTAARKKTRASNGNGGEEPETDADDSIDVP